MHHSVKHRLSKTEVPERSVSLGSGLTTGQSGRDVRRQFGQGMTEYIVIVALIAIAAVTASGFFGARVQAQFVSMGKEISGEQGAPTGGVAAPTPAPAKLGNYVTN